MTELGEPLRALRTNIRFLGGGSPPRVIAVTSASSGEGRTSTAIDLSAILAEAGHTVLLVGGDLRDAALGSRLGLNQDRGLSTVLSGEHHVEDVIVPGAFGGVSVLPSGPVPPNPSELLGSDRAQLLLESLRGDYRYVIVDTPPLLDATDGAILTALADGAVVLARTGRTTRDKLRRAIKVLDGVGGTVLGVVTTFEPSTRRSSKTAPPRPPTKVLRLQRHPRSPTPPRAGTPRQRAILRARRRAEASSMSPRFAVRVGVVLTAAAVSISCSQQPSVMLLPMLPRLPSPRRRGRRNHRHRRTSVVRSQGR